MSTGGSCLAQFDADADTIVKIVDPTPSNGERPQTQPFCSVQCLLDTLHG